MEFLGVGPLEFFLVILIALIIFGPQDMVKAGRTLAKFMRTIVTSDTWRLVSQVSSDLRNLPSRMIREAGIDELNEDLNEIRAIQSDLKLKELNKDIMEKTRVDVSDWITPPASVSPQNELETGETPEPPSPDPTSKPDQDPGPELPVEKASQTTEVHLPDNESN